MATSREASRTLASIAFAFALAFAMTLTMTSTANAADTPTKTPDALARAQQIKQRGDDALVAGRPAEALTAYTEAYELSSDPALLFNKGRAHEALGDLPQAIAALEAFDATASQDLKAHVPGLANLIATLRKSVTTITITCDVDAALIRLRDRTIGKCPLRAPVVVLAGKAARLEVTAEGYFPWSRDLDLPPEGTGAFDVHLVPKATMGLLIVRSSVANSTVAIDGKSMGQVPYETNVAAGAHAIELTRDGYEPSKTSVVITAGERREVDVPLKQEAGILKKWWFWTIATVVIAGGITTVLVLTSDKDPTPGTVPPGVVKAGSGGAVVRF